jgi:hypothetical protein
VTVNYGSESGFVGSHAPIVLDDQCNHYKTWCCSHKRLVHLHAGYGSAVRSARLIYQYIVAKTMNRCLQKPSNKPRL